MRYRNPEFSLSLLQFAFKSFLGCTIEMSEASFMSNADLYEDPPPIRRANPPDQSPRDNLEPATQRETGTEGTVFWIKPTVVGRDKYGSLWGMSVLVPPSETGKTPSKEAVWSLLSSCSPWLALLPQKLSLDNEGEDRGKSRDNVYLERYEKAIRSANESVLERHGWGMHVHQPHKLGQPSWKDLEQFCDKMTMSYGMQAPWVGVQLSKTKLHEGQVTVVLSDKVVLKSRYIYGTWQQPSDDTMTLPEDFCSVAGAEYVQNRIYNMIPRDELLSQASREGPFDTELVESIKEKMTRLFEELEGKGMPAFTFDIYTPVDKDSDPGKDFRYTADNLVLSSEPEMDNPEANGSSNDG